MIATLDEFVAWARYLTWSEDHYKRFDEEVAKDASSDSTADYAWFFGRSAQWYSSLCVVIEGWRTLDLHDNIIDGLLRKGDPFCQLFSDFRDGISRFSQEFVSTAAAGALLNRAVPALPWALALRNEFRRFMWQWPASVAGDRAEAAQLRDQLRAILGWFPDDCVVAEIDSLERTVAEAEACLRSADDSPAAADLVAAADMARKAARDTRKRYLSQQQEYVTKEWLSANDLEPPAER